MERVGALTMMDLFSGADGILEEFMQAGFEVLLGEDRDPNSVRTFQRRHGRDVEFRIKDLSADHIRRERGNRDIAVLTANPLYWAFSTTSALSLRSQNKPTILRNPLNRFYREVRRIVKELQPPFFVIENIRKMLTMSNGHVKNEIGRKLDGAYDVLFYHENMADFGVCRREDATLSDRAESASVTIIDFKNYFRVCT